MTPSEASLRGQLAAHVRWSRTVDRQAATAKARAAAMSRFEREVDPEGMLTPAQRAPLAENAKRAYYARLALKRHQR